MHLALRRKFKSCMRARPLKFSQTNTCIKDTGAHEMVHMCVRGSHGAQWSNPLMPNGPLCISPQVPHTDEPNKLYYLWFVACWYCIYDENLDLFVKRKRVKRLSVP